MRVDFVTVDVFTNAQFGGNPVAVIPDGRGLTAAQMQKIAEALDIYRLSYRKYPTTGEGLQALATPKNGEGPTMDTIRT